VGAVTRQKVERYGVMLTLVLLGDSIAFGQGAARPADALGPRLTSLLAAGGIQVKPVVYAVPGAQSSGLAHQVSQARKINPDLALIIIGANDLSRFVPVAQAAAHLEAAVRSLTASGTAVVVVPAPDMSVFSWLPRHVRDLVRNASTALQQAQTQAAVAAGARVVTTGPAVWERFTAEPSLISTDRFHPSSAGYSFIATVIWPAIEAAAKEVAARPRR
jgi:lysophospholipase L1-like esterase